MIERYTLLEIEKLRDHFHLTSGLPKGVKRNYNISPTLQAPVIVQRGEKIVVEQMKWGFIPHRAKDTNSVFRYKTYNTPEKGLFTKSTSREAIRTRRCLVPANGFYVWQKSDNGKQPYYITNTAEGHTLLAYSGIFSVWEDAEGVEHSTFSILTTESTNDISSVTETMPVIIDESHYAAWLDGNIYESSDLYDMMRPYPQGRLAAVKVSQDVNSVKVNKPALIAPVGA